VSTIGDVTTIPAGWYPDPENNARSRWWDGTAWTASVSEPQPPAPPLEPFVQASLPGPQTHFEQRPFEPAAQVPAAELPAAQPAFMPQQAELQQFVNPTGSHAALPSDGTLTRRQLRELTASGAVPVAAVAPEPAAPAIAVPAPTAAPGTLYGDVAVMPSYGTPVTPAAPAAPVYEPAPAAVVEPVVAPVVAPLVVPPVAEAATPAPYVAPALPLSAYPGPAVPAQAAAAPERPALAAIAAPVTSYEGLASPAMVPQGSEAPKSPFASSTNPFSDPSVIVAPVAAATPAVDPGFAPAANPFASSNNPFSASSANPFSGPVEFPTAQESASPFNFDVTPATPEPQRNAGGAQTGGIWFFAIIPLLQAGIAWLVYVYLATGVTEPLSLVTLVAPVILYLLAAEKDRKKLGDLGHDRVPSVLLAIFPLIYLIVRTVRVGRAGAGPFVAWILAGLISGAAVNLLVVPVILTAVLALI